MSLFNSKELSEALNINIKKNISFDGISIDSRDIKKNSLLGEVIYFKCMIASISTEIPNGKALDPTAALVCLP